VTPLRGVTSVSCALCATGANSGKDDQGRPLNPRPPESASLVHRRHPRHGTSTVPLHQRPVAISPDGGLVAVGGFTGPGVGTQNIYLFDRADGRLRQRIPGLASAVSHLTFSPDGRLLAATLYGANGLRVYRAPADPGAQWSQVFSDPGYGNSSLWAAFAPDGRLATSSYDARVRLYGAKLKRLAERETLAIRTSSGVGCWVSLRSTQPTTRPGRILVQSGSPDGAR
jgi:WD40 repeat protein